jgi:hypothetical protein
VSVNADHDPVNADLGHANADLGHANADLDLTDADLGHANADRGREVPDRQDAARNPGLAARHREQTHANPGPEPADRSPAFEMLVEPQQHLGVQRRVRDLALRERSLCPVARVLSLVELHAELPRTDVAKPMPAHAAARLADRRPPRRPWPAAPR